MLRYLFYDYKLYIHMISSSSSTGIFTRYIDTEKMKYLLFFCFFPHSVFLFWVLSVCVSVCAPSNSGSKYWMCWKWRRHCDRPAFQSSERQSDIQTGRQTDICTQFSQLYWHDRVCLTVWMAGILLVPSVMGVWVCTFAKKQTFKAGSQSVSQPVIQFLVNFFRMYSLKYTQSHTDTHLYVHK